MKINEKDVFLAGFDVNLAEMMTKQVENLGSGFVCLSNEDQEKGPNCEYIHNLTVKHIPVPAEQLHELPDEVVVDGETFHKLAKYTARRAADAVQSMERQMLKAVTVTVDHNATKTVTFDQVVALCQALQGDASEWKRLHLNEIKDKINGRR